jgi:uncharacterized protein (TIGR02117 family)
MLSATATRSSVPSAPATSGWASPTADERGRRAGRRRAPLLVVGALILTGCLGPVAGLYPPSEHETAPVVWVVDHGWHTGLVVRAADLPGDLWPERADFPNVRFLEVAWGDRDFYVAPRGTSGLALRAALISQGSVLHVVGFSEPVRAYFAGQEVIAVTLSRRGFEALARFVDAAHARAGAARATRLAPGLYGDSGFYPAGGRYSLLNTCNTWIAAALREAGAPITPLWAATAGGVLRQVRSFGRVVPPGL